MGKGTQILAFLLIAILGLTMPGFSQSVKLSWGGNPEPDVKYYVIYRAEVSNPTSQIAQVPATQTSYSDQDIVLGRIYYYRITAMDSAGNMSEFSEEVLIATDITTPVELTSFSAEVKDNAIALTWTTASETNNYGFEIERSQGNHNFEKIGFVEGNGTVVEPQNYTFIDDNVTEGSYSYRLKQIDSDGSHKYSSIINIRVSLPEDFELGQNYPNPFNPETNFDYYVPGGSDVSLTIYDVLGRKVKTLIDGFKAAGRHHIKWDGTDEFSKKVASGVYFAKFVGENFQQTRKILLQK